MGSTPTVRTLRPRRFCWEQNRTAYGAAPSYSRGMDDIAGTTPPSREPLWRELVGERLRDRRHERGETLDDVARRAGLSRQYLSEIERGRKDPSSEMIEAVSGALGLSLADLTLGVAQRLIAISRPASPRPVERRSALALAA